MPVGSFLAKAEALKAKGMMAMFSSDMGLLKAEFMTGAKAWRAQARNRRLRIARVEADGDVEKAIEIQTDYAKTAYEGFVAGATRISELKAGSADLMVGVPADLKASLDKTPGVKTIVAPAIGPPSSPATTIG